MPLRKFEGGGGKVGADDRLQAVDHAMAADVSAVKGRPRSFMITL